MKTLCSLSLAAALALSACNAAVPPPPFIGPPPPPPGAPAGCPIASSSDWAAWIDAMPGPNGGPKLVVTGKVEVPTGGYMPRLQIGHVAESYPVQVTVNLDPNPPSGAATQAVVTHEVRGVWPMPQPVGSVTVRCGAQTLARISPVQTAH